MTILHIPDQKVAKKNIHYQLVMSCVHYLGNQSGMKRVTTGPFKDTNKKSNTYGKDVAGRLYKFQKGTGVEITEPVVRVEDLEWFHNHPEYEVVLDEKHLSEGDGDFKRAEPYIKKGLKLAKSWNVRNIKEEKLAKAEAEAEAKKKK